jgi:hypothetical protein
MPKGPKGEVRPGYFFMGIAESSTRLEALAGWLRLRGKSRCYAN